MRLSPPTLPRRGWWRTQMTCRFGAEGTRILDRIEVTYRDLLGDRPEIATERPALDWHLRMSIAPILAAYLVLREETGDQPTAHRLAEELTIGLTPWLTLYAWWERANKPFSALWPFYRPVLTHYGAPELTEVFSRTEAR